MASVSAASHRNSVSLLVRQSVNCRQQGSIFDIHHQRPRYSVAGRRLTLCAFLLFSLIPLSSSSLSVSPLSSLKFHPVTREKKSNIQHIRQWLREAHMKHTSRLQPSSVQDQFSPSTAYDHQLFQQSDRPFSRDIYAVDYPQFRPRARLELQLPLQHYQKSEDTDLLSSSFWSILFAHRVPAGRRRVFTKKTAAEKVLADAITGRHTQLYMKRNVLGEKQGGIMDTIAEAERTGGEDTGEGTGETRESEQERIGQDGDGQKLYSTRDQIGRTPKYSNTIGVLLARQVRDVENAASDFNTNTDTSSSRQGEDDGDAGAAPAASDDQGNEAATERPLKSQSTSLAKDYKQSGSCFSKSCTSQGDIVCEISKASSSCIHTETSSQNFPSKPRELNISQIVTKDASRFNITWKGPYNFSYQKVKGYEMHVTFFKYGGTNDVTCYFFNMSETNWSQVRNVHDVVYYLDCIQLRSDVFTKIHVSLFSYPRAEGAHDESHIEKHAMNIVVTTTHGGWDPSIDAVQDNQSRSLIITIGKVLDLRPDSITICFQVNKFVNCEKNIDIVRLESPPIIYRYKVTGLKSKQNYTIVIKPFKNNLPADSWISKVDPVYVDFGPEVSQLEKEAQGVQTEVIIGVVGVTFVAILIVIFLVCFRQRTCEFLHKLSIFRCCTLWPVQNMALIDVLYLYLVENPPHFESLVLSHLKFLTKYMNLRYIDLISELREKQNNSPNLENDELLDKVCENRRLLIYVSPSLIRQLKSTEGINGSGLDRGGRMRVADVAEGVNLIPWEFDIPLQQVVGRLATSTRFQGNHKKPIFIFSGCFPSDRANLKYLSEHEHYKPLRRFFVSTCVRGHPVKLESPDALLKKLSSCQHRAVEEGVWQSRAHVLDAATHLYQLLQARDFDVPEPETELESITYNVPQNQRVPVDCGGQRGTDARRYDPANKKGNYHQDSGIPSCEFSDDQLPCDFFPPDKASIDDISVAFRNVNLTSGWSEKDQFLLQSDRSGRL